MTVYRKDVYCEFEFLKEFRDSYVHFHFLPFVDNRAEKVWRNVSDFILKSHLMLDISVQTFKKMTRNDNVLLYLWKQVTGGSYEISFVNEHNVKSVENLITKQEGLDKVYLLAKQDDICKELAEQYGVVVLSPTCWQSNEMAKKYDYLFRDCGSPISREEAFEWRGILRSEYNLSNCNSMIIIDNYIHENTKQNLLPIIDVILPKSLRDITFHLTIFTLLDKDNKVKYDKMYNDIVQRIKETKPELKCEVELYVLNRTPPKETKQWRFHDRTILTNNVAIGSGAGFSLLDNNNKPVNITDVRILHPGIQNCSDACDQTCINLIENAKTIVKKIENCGYGKHYPKESSCKNRLILKHPDIKEL